MFDITQDSLRARGFKKDREMQHTQTTWWSHPDYNLRITLCTKPNSIKLRMKTCSCNMVATADYNLQRLDHFLAGCDMSPLTPNSSDECTHPLSTTKH